MASSRLHTAERWRAVAYSKEVRQQFIMMRAKGMSFNKIHEVLGVSKPVLLKWRVMYDKEIAEHEYFELQSLLESHRLTKKARLEEEISEHDRVLEAIKAKDFKNESLYDLRKRLRELRESIDVQTKYDSARTGRGWEYGGKKGTFSLDINGDIKCPDGFPLFDRPNVEN